MCVPSSFDSCGACSASDCAWDSVRYGTRHHRSAITGGPRYNPPSLPLPFPCLTSACTAGPVSTHRGSGPGPPARWLRFRAAQPRPRHGVWTALRKIRLRATQCFALRSTLLFNLRCCATAGGLSLLLHQQGGRRRSRLHDRQRSLLLEDGLRRRSFQGLVGQAGGNRHAEPLQRRIF